LYPSGDHKTVTPPGNGAERFPQFHPLSAAKNTSTPRRTNSNRIHTSTLRRPTNRNNTRTATGCTCGATSYGMEGFSEKCSNEGKWFVDTIILPYLKEIERG